METMTFGQMMMAFEDAIQRKEKICFARLIAGKDGWEFENPGEWITYDMKQSIFSEDAAPEIDYRRYSPNMVRNGVPVPYLRLGFTADDLTARWVVYEPVK